MKISFQTNYGGSVEGRMRSLAGFDPLSAGGYSLIGKFEPLSVILTQTGDMWEIQVPDHSLHVFWLYTPPSERLVWLLGANASLPSFQMGVDLGGKPATFIVTGGMIEAFATNPFSGNVGRHAQLVFGQDYYPNLPQVVPGKLANPFYAIGAFAVHQGWIPQLLGKGTPPNIEDPENEKAPAFPTSHQTSQVSPQCQHFIPVNLPSDLPHIGGAMVGEQVLLLIDGMLVPLDRLIDHLAQLGPNWTTFLQSQADTLEASAAVLRILATHSSLAQSPESWPSPKKTTKKRH